MIRKNKLKIWRPLGDDTPKEAWVESICDDEQGRLFSEFIGVQRGFRSCVEILMHM